MKKGTYSIKRQFALIFIGLMAGTIMLCWLINNSLLERFYENRREKVLLETYQLLNAATESGRGSLGELQIEMERISGRYNIMGVILDMNSMVVYAFGDDMTILRGLLWDRIYAPDSVVVERVIRSDDNYVIQKVTDSITKTEYMEIWGWFSDGEMFLMRTPLENIRESVEISNRFLLYVGLAGILISSLVIWLVTRKITEPIRELTDISERMTRLDFDAKYHGKGRNEIALLGDNINKLSGTLEETIRDLKTANNELIKDIEEKNEIDEMRKEFLSNVSHELKTPLALIQGYAEGLREGVSEDAESRRYYCDVIMDEASKMNVMVKKLMTLNELESGGGAAELERIDIVTLIVNYVQSARILAERNDISVKMEHYDSLYVWADEFKTEEVFANYFSNAVNYCEGDRVIDIRLTKTDGKVRVTVFNTGRPIPEEYIGHIWEKFYKVDKARTREYGGSGVGLSIVKAIMESMNQKYGVDNYENGVAFWFELDAVGKDDIQV